MSNFCVSGDYLAEDEPSEHFLIILSFLIKMSETLNTSSACFKSGLKAEKGKSFFKANIKKKRNFDSLSSYALLFSALDAVRVVFFRQTAQERMLLVLAVPVRKAQNENYLSLADCRESCNVSSYDNKKYLLVHSSIFTLS